VIDQTRFAPIFEDGEFTIAYAPTVIVAIEVKSSLRNSIREALENIGIAFSLHSNSKHESHPHLFTAILGFSDRTNSKFSRGRLSPSEAKNIAGHVAREYSSLVPSPPDKPRGFDDPSNIRFPAVICSLENPPWVAHYQYCKNKHDQGNTGLPCLVFRHVGIPDSKQAVTNHSLHFLLEWIAHHCSGYLAERTPAQNGALHIQEMTKVLNWSVDYEELLSPISLLPPSPSLIEAFPSVVFLRADEYRPRAPGQNA
jgi:hypothetical protein